MPHGQCQLGKKSEVFKNLLLCLSTLTRGKNYRSPDNVHEALDQI